MHVLIVLLHSNGACSIIKFIKNTLHTYSLHKSLYTHTLQKTYTHTHTLTTHTSHIHTHYTH